MSFGEPGAVLMPHVYDVSNCVFKRGVAFMGFYLCQSCSLSYNEIQFYSITRF